MRFILIGLVGALLTAGVPAAPAAADEPKTTAGVSARQLALSRRYVELMQGDQLEDMVRASIAEQAGADNGLDGVPEEDRAFLVDMAGDVASELMPEMLDRLVPVYARTFTEVELEALIGFYDTEVGRSIVLKTMASMPEANAAMMEVLPRMMEKMAARTCARFGCSAEEMEAMQGAMGVEPQARSKKQVTP